MFPPDQIKFLTDSIPAFVAAETEAEKLLFYCTVVDLFLQKFPLDGPGPFQCSCRSTFPSARQALEIVSWSLFRLTIV